jgi:hypothetical protein
MGGGPSPPDPAPPPEVEDDNKTLQELAETRAMLDRKRTGRSALRINPAVQTPRNTGLKI